MTTERTAPSHPPETQEHTTSRSRLRKVLGIVLPSLIAAVLLVAVLPALADLSDVWGTVRSLGLGEVVLLLSLAAWNILTYQFVMMAALPGLPLSQAFMVGQISTAVSNTVPAGSAVGVGVTYAMFSSYGYSSGAIAIAAALTGLWNTFVKLGLPIAALAMLAFRGNPSTAMLSAAVIGLLILVVAVALMVVIASSERLATMIGAQAGRIASAAARPLGRGPFLHWEDALCSFRRRTATVLKQRWLLLTVATLVSHLSLYALLLATLRAVGVPPELLTWEEILAAFALVRLVTALPITPGGVGIVEVGMAGALIVAGGAEAGVVAAVLIYRTLSYAIQIPIGAGCWVAWRITGRKRRTSLRASGEM